MVFGVLRLKLGCHFLTAIGLLERGRSRAPRGVDSPGLLQLSNNPTKRPYGAARSCGGPALDALGPQNVLGCLVSRWGATVGCSIGLLPQIGGRCHMKRGAAATGRLSWEQGGNPTSMVGKLQGRGDPGGFPSRLSQSPVTNIGLG